MANMSFGTNGSYAPCSNYPEVQTAVTDAVNHGLVLVAAAGNSSSDVAGVTPASCTGVIAVAASDRNNALAAYSNLGARIDITAPGGGGNASDGMFGSGINCPSGPFYIRFWQDPYSGTLGAVSTWTDEKDYSHLTSGDYCYRYLSGTSMASPHVAGVAALVLSQFPTMTPAQVSARLTSTASPMSCGANCGAGPLNAAAAVYAPGASPCTDDGDMCLSSSYTCRGRGGLVVNLPCRSGNVCCVL